MLKSKRFKLLKIKIEFKIQIEYKVRSSGQGIKTATHTIPKKESFKYSKSILKDSENIDEDVTY